MRFPGGKGTACSAGGDWRAARLRGAARVRSQGFGAEGGARGKRPLGEPGESRGGRAPAAWAHHLWRGLRAVPNAPRSSAHLCVEGAAAPCSLVLPGPLPSIADSTCRALPVKLRFQLFLRTLHFSPFLSVSTF